MTLITMPSTPSFKSSNWGIRRAVAIAESPFTGAQQAQVYSKAQWYATLTLPPMKRSLAVQWQAFFMKLNGRGNTFLLGDPDGKTAMGDTPPSSVSVAASAAAGATTVNLTLGTGKTLNTGSYIQFGTGSDSRLHMVVDDNTGDGNVTIEPALKAAITTSTSADISSPQGVFRMDTNELTWDADEIKYGISFSCSEAI